MRRALALAIIAAACAVPARADDAAHGYAVIRPSLVKVWSFDAQGRPTESGSGVVIVSNHARSVVVTAAHVVAHAVRISVDVDRDRHDLHAAIGARGPRDLVTLEVDRGDLTPATFAPRAHAVVEGNVIAVAGYVKHDELIGVVGQEPRLLYPGTVSARPENGTYLELANVQVEEGLSGGPVFDPQTGEVLGIVTSRTSDRRGGFADAAAPVVLPFLGAHAVAYREAGVVAPQPSPVATPKAAAKAPPKAVVLAMATPAPIAPPAAPAVAVNRPRAWQALERTPHRFAYYHRGCAVVLSLKVSDLAFGLPDASGAPGETHLRLRVARRVAPVAACADIAESDASDADYALAASSFAGTRLTMRFSRIVDGDGATDDALFPSDIGVDADVAGSPVTAHLQLIDTDWDDQIDVIASTRR